MTDPTTFPPLVTDYEVDWDRPPEGEPWPEALTHYEHGHVFLPNGYIISIIRAHIPATEDTIEFKSTGYEDGMWELGLLREPTYAASLFGMVGIPAPELEDLIPQGKDEHVKEGIAGPLNNAEVNALIASVAARPRYSEGPETPLF